MDRLEVSSSVNTPARFASLGMGVGLRPPHYEAVLTSRPKLDWFEATSENYMGISAGQGGRPIQILERIRSDYPIVLHGVSLSIGSTDPVNKDYLRKLKGLADRLEPEWLSDHLCWTGVDNENLHDLLPLPYTEEALGHLSERISLVQEFLGRQMLFENVSSYVAFEHSEMTEWEFLAELSKKADCGILLDINNIYVSAINHGFDPLAYLECIPRDRVGQMHLAGHSRHETPDGSYLLDTHDHPVPDAVWDLYRFAIKRFGAVSTLIEWDAAIPEFGILMAEAEKAKVIHNAG